MRAARRAVPGTVLALAVLAVLVVLVGMLLVLPVGRASAATYRVAMSGYAFSPTTLTITAGSTVTWTNQDTAPHDVKTTSAPAAFHSPMLNKGGSWSFTFNTPGTYAYYCTVHPNMTARIVVQAAAPKTSAPAPTHDHSGTGSSTGHQSSGHHATAPSPTAATRSPASSPVRSTPSTSAPASAPPGSPTPAPTPASVPQTQVTASTTRPLDPLLILTGIVAGVAVLCLLLVGSRASRTREEKP
ncbi:MULTISPECIES: plastocyanin/azurin family copper-binding protein [unclassified Streptomyces]|uniref:cupredoxin domain-containing protein n=1 Tax=unclassified Streptomyces TaxID=2593676 RepID=UPI0023666A83|nr:MULTISPECIES: plastocyanin/azurin family copper-binding protein [unclassified Streptomyces]MDF3149288.1 plastocyanin/azurin family copper-binding protein [Streptomyces sp. T21Q-yed]WDF38610.1 plastocyanin/azurin family copper-binding protein [Streptomyces sp. T12]